MFVLPLYACIVRFSNLKSLAAMHKAWPRLLKRMNANKVDADDRQLVVASRIWFCLYLFEHQSVKFLQYSVSALY